MKFLIYNIAYGTGAPGGRCGQLLSLPRYLRTARTHLEKVIDCIAERNPDVAGLLEVDRGSFRTGYADQGSMIARALHLYACGAVKYAPGSLPRRIPILREQANIFLTRFPRNPCAFHYFPSGMKRLALETECGGVRFFLLHLALSAAVRSEQLNALKEILRPIQTPYLVGGDFNLFRGKGELRSFMKELGLKSANRTNLPTFPSWAPEQQLDYILYSPQIRPVRFEVGTEKASDHLPVMLDFRTVP